VSAGPGLLARKEHGEQAQMLAGRVDKHFECRLANAELARPGAVGVGAQARRAFPLQSLNMCRSIGVEYAVRWWMSAGARIPRPEQCRYAQALAANAAAFRLNGRF